MSNPDFNDVLMLIPGSVDFDDVTSNAIDLTPTGAVISNTDQLNGADTMFFDGVDDLAKRASPPTALVDLDTNDYTLDGWLYVRSHKQGSSSQGILFSNGDGGGLEFWSWGPAANGKITHRWFNGSSNEIINSSDGVVALDVWQYFAMVYDATSSTMSAYIGENRVLNFSVSNMEHSAANDFLVGKAGNVFLDGSVSNIRCTPGVALHSGATIIPPTAPFPTSVGPVIDVQPESQTVPAGLPVEFLVVATATSGSLSYQWHETTEGLLSGETSDTLIFTSAFSKDGNGYHVEVTDDIATVDSATAILTVTDSPRRILLDPSEYTVKFGYRDPINTRGVITLNTPIDEGKHIQIERATPITNEQVFPPNKPFVAEGFEYATDKLTFILQELEGSLCDCRTVKTTPGYIGDPNDPTDPDGPSPVDECLPYACNAVETYALETGDLWIPFDDPNTSPTVPEFIHHNKGFEIIFFLELSGHQFGKLWGDAEWDQTTSAGIDYTPCADLVVAHIRGQNQAKYVVVDSTAYATSGSVSAWMKSTNITRIFQSNWDGTYIADGNGVPQNADYSAWVGIDTGAETISIGGGAALVGPTDIFTLPSVDLVEGFSITIKYVISSEAESISPTREDIHYTSSFNVYINGVLAVNNHSREWTFVDVRKGTFESSPAERGYRLFNDTAVAFDVLVTTRNVNASDVDLVYRRQKTTYTPPESCNT